MAASSKPSINPTSPKNQGRFSTGGRKGHIIPSKTPVPISEEEEVFSHSPVRQMKQVRKSKSEKGKLKIYGSAQDLGLGNTKWHISLPNIHDTQQYDTKDNDDLSHSPSRSQGLKSPLPPPPSNPPPILDSSSTNDQTKGREMVKSASAGAINIIHPSLGKAFALQRSAAIKPTVATVREDKKAEKKGEKLRKGPPPKVPPPFSIKARAATVVSAAIQEHMQSSTRSAPGGFQKNDENDRNVKLPINVKGRTQSECAVNVPEDRKETQKTNSGSATQDEEPQLTASMEGGVKSLARYFSARSKEGLTTPAPLPKNGQSRVRAVRGRQLFRNAVRKTTSIPETCNEESESSTGEVQVHRLPPIRSISNDPDEKYEVLHNIGSVVSSGSPTHMSIFSWYNVDADSKSDVCNVTKKRYQNVFDDEAFACFDKTGHAKGDKDSPVSPKSPFKEYQNVLVETATLEGTAPDVQSAGESSHKEKKPIPLPRTQSREKGMGLQNGRVRHLATSDSEGTLFVSTSQSSINNRVSDYIEMASSFDSGSTKVHEIKSSPTSPGIVVMGALDPEWRANFEEMIQKEIEMTEGFSDSDEPEVAGQEHESVLEERMPFVRSPPIIPAKKAALKKTQSHNPNEPNIRRRNTPKEKRELRKGVCSDTDQLEQEEYIAMKSTQYESPVNNTPLPSLTSSGIHSENSSLSIPKPAAGMEPRSSTYYLKILPSPMVKPPEETLTAENPVPIKHYYIEINVPHDASLESPSKKDQGDVSRGPTLPPKSSPIHIPASGKHKLKYPKISVGPAHYPEIVKGEKVGKTPYSRVKVNDDLTEEPSAIDSNAFERQRSQGSIFANEMMNYVDRPLPPPPLNDAIYYKTVNYPLSHIPAMRQVWHHEYIEIDEEELNKKNATPFPKSAEGWINIHAAGGPIRVGDTKLRARTTLAPPPPVPKRPSCPYVEIDSEEMEEMASSLSSEQIERSNNIHGRLKYQWGASDEPRSARNNGPPPEVPCRSEESRQRSFSSSGEYAYPIIPGLKFQWMNIKRGEGDQAYFTPRVPLPTASEKKSLMETIKEKSAMSEHPPTLPPKTESLLREQKGYIPRNINRPSPYLVPVSIVKSRNLSDTQYDHLNDRVPSPDPQQPKSPKEVVSNLRKELFGEDRNGDDDTSSKVGKSTGLPEHLQQKKKAMFPPYHPMPYAISVDLKQKVNNSPPPKVPKKQRKASKEEDSSMRIEESKHVDQDLVKRGETSPNTVAQSLPDILAVRKARLQHRIDRNSLAMIMRNKSAIVKQLEKENDSPKSQRKPMLASSESESRKDVSVVRSLGDILLDVDSLLQRRMCSEDDLIAAIEKQLNIKLVKKQPSSSDREKKKSNEGGILEDSVQVTDQDVEEVVSFMNRKQLSPHQSPSAVTGESGAEEGWTEASVVFKSDQQQESDLESASYNTTKQRSSTFIVNTVEDIERKQQSTVNMHLHADKEQHSPIYYGRNQLPSENSEEELHGSPEKHIRDSRSSSVGLKPLRRVKARRKTNPASDMANLNSGMLPLLL